MASNSTSASTLSCKTERELENEHTNAFEGIAPSPSTSDRPKMPDRKLPYDVFINHRGPDVKHTLAASLYNTLTVMGLRVFLDKEELDLGDFLPAEIQEAMRSASLHIAIFSPNYAESPWCLAELAFMLKTGTQIVPVFYHVETDVVRYAKGVYAEAFYRHEEKGRYNSKMLGEWKNALKNVSFNFGDMVHNEDDEGRLLKNIVNRVLKEIKNVPFEVAKHPVGLDEAIKDFERTTFQSTESQDTVQIVGIWGMGGSGKTTLAKQIYNNKCAIMDKSSFLLDVRDAASRSKLHKKQKKLLEDLGLKGVSIENIEEGKRILSSRLQSIRVLIILDDVDNVDQLDALVPKRDSLGWGSLIVVTSREFEVLQCWGISFIYKMKLLDPPHAKQLFCWHAFLKPTPLRGFEDLIENFLNVCNGLPLSLKIFGAQLYGKSSKDYWKTQLHKISRILHKDVKDRLKISYDALDDEEKQIFLDTACFFIGEKKTLAIAAWDGLEWSGLHSCESLLNKCLIELDDGDFIRMHDHLRDLGREIANNHSPYRLWSTQQIINVDGEAQRICIRGIMATTFGCTSKFEEFSLCSQGRKIIVNTNRGYCSFTPSLLGLKFFHVRGNYFNQIIADISKDLVWLRWFDIGHKNLGSLGSLKNLRVLELYEKEASKHFLEELWEPDSNAPVQLSELVISECYNFQRFPKSIGCLRDLKKLVLNSFGNKMRSLPKEFCSLQSLEHLELSGCPELSSLPSSFGHLRNLRYLDLSNCEELKRLPVSFKELRLLRHLNLRGCSKLTLESNVLENMMKLEHLDLSKCEQLKEWPRHITDQGSLRELYLGGINRVREIPMNISQLSKLQVMTIGSELLACLPTFLGDLSSLTTLVIDNCPKLQCIPESLGHLNLLKHLEISDSGLQSLPKSVRQLNNLQTLSVLGCPISQLDLRAWSFASSLYSLKQINLSRTEVSKISIPQDCCPCLETLFLDFNKCLMEIEILPSTVRDIRVTWCKMVRSMLGIDGLVNIQSLQIRECPKLDALPRFAQFSFLRKFKLQGCYRVREIHGLEHCTALEELTLETRWKGVGIQRLERMERLRIVKLTAISRSAVEGCIESLKKWPEEVLICTRAVLNAGSFANFIFRYLSVIDSTGNQNMSSNTQGTLICFVVECQSPKTKLALCGDNVEKSSTELEEGKWAWIGLFSQSSSWHKTKEYRVKEGVSSAFLEGGAFSIPIRSKPGIIPLSSIFSQSPTSMISTISSYEVEIPFVLRGEMETLVDAFKFLWKTIPH